MGCEENEELVVNLHAETQNGLDEMIEWQIRGVSESHFSFFFLLLDVRKMKSWLLTYRLKHRMDWMR